MSKDELIRKLQAACNRSLVDFPTLIDQCRDGRAQFHEVEDAVGVTSLETSPWQKTCYIIVAAGSLAGLRALNLKIEEFAKSNNCQAIRTVGRRGFEKKYQSISEGYSIVGMIYEKKLEV